MAAYGALVSVMNDLELIPIHPTHSFSFDDKQIASLSQSVNFLIDFMETYDSHGCTREAAQLLESRIAAAAHAAQDVIETHVVDQLLAGTTLVGKSTCCFLLDLQKATDNMDIVKREATLFKERSGSKATYSARASSEPLTSEKNATVGFDAVVVRLMAMLTGEPSGQRVIPIAGMGGMGKTTLARNVFEHLLIQQHFDVRLWATISQEYSVQYILKELISQNSINVSDQLGEKLHKMLWGRRYLIVLDDMWSVDAWDEIQMFLPDNENGSRVIVTTRLSNLADHLNSSPFEMDFLDDDQSWELFCGRTFREEDCPDELEEIGKKIVQRCRGLPLSIIVIGGHFRRSSRVIEYWEMVANSMNPILNLGADDQCLKIISLSYDHLPACLKPCFLYLGIFQEDKLVDASQLLRNWIAEGFVKGKKGLSLEEVAEDYLKDLIDRNLILVRERRWNGKVENFVIHDIVRELCLKVGEQEKFLGVLDTTNVIGASRERRVVVPEEISSLQRHSFGAMQLPSLLRSLICQKNLPSLLCSLICQKSCFIDEMCVDFKLLRLLSHVCVLLEKNDTDSPTTNFHLVNLRYLDSNLIPSSVSLFWNMQTLIITNVGNSVVYEIWDMTQLRHLEFAPAQLLLDPLPGVINDQEKCIVLENLHTLLGVRNLRLTEEVCKRMPNIKKLSVFYYDLPDDYRASSSYYCPHNLGRLNKLESLECVFGDPYKWRDVVLSFVLPSSLEELSLWNCHWEDLTKIIKSLPRLGSLVLLYIGGPEWDFAEKEFPCLKVLKISSFGDLIDWKANSSHFPVLEILYVSGAPKLSEIPFDIGEIPTLRHIELRWCSLSAAVSAMRIVVEQESLGNEDLLLTVNIGEMEEVERFRTMVQEECLMTNNLHLYCCDKKIKAF